MPPPRRTSGAVAEDLGLSYSPRTGMHFFDLLLVKGYYNSGVRSREAGVASIRGHPHRRASVSQSLFAPIRQGYSGEEGRNRRRRHLRAE